MTAEHHDPVSVADVAAEIRLRLPNVTDQHMHWLLYFAQGHHLAMFDVPLFREPIVAGSDGPVVVFETAEASGVGIPAGQPTPPEAQGENDATT